MQVILIAATTKDGFIARSKTDRSFDWTSAQDKAFYISTIRSADALIMGQTTFQTITKFPKGKLVVILTHHPDTFVNPKPDIITTWATDQTPSEILDNLKNRGVNIVVVCGGASVYTQFLTSGVVDAVYLTREEDVIFGAGVPLTPTPLLPAHPTKTIPLSTTTTLLEYQLKK